MQQYTTITTNKREKKIIDRKKIALHKKVEICFYFV